MFKKIAVISAVVVVIVSVCCVPVSAASYDVKIDTFEQAINPNDTSAHVRPADGYDGTWVNAFPLLEHFTDSMWMVSEIPALTEAARIDVTLNEISWWAFIQPSRPLDYINLHLVFLDENYDVLYSEFVDGFNVTTYQVTSDGFTTSIDDMRYITKAKYVGLNLMANFDLAAGYMYFTKFDLRVVVRDSAYIQQEQTNEKLDEIIDQPEQEKQEAGSSGNDAIDGITSVIPADNDGVIAAVKRLADAMSYAGTNAKWTFPALYLPKIDGVMERVQLTDELPIDFNEWINKIPSNILRLVQMVCSIALILYCFKELYKLIEYILTMKGGGSSE